MGFIGILFWFVLGPVLFAFGMGYVMGRNRLRVKFYRSRPQRDT